MGIIQSTPSNIIIYQSFNLSIITYNEYLDPYTTYFITINSINYTYNTLTDNGDGTSTLVFNNVVVTNTGTIPFTLYGDTNTNIILTSNLEVSPICYLKGTKILCQIDGVEQYVRIEELKRIVNLKILQIKVLKKVPSYINYPKKKIPN